MHMNALFIILTFVIVITVIVLADSLTSAMLILSVLANFLVISSQFKMSTKDIMLECDPMPNLLNQSSIESLDYPVSPPTVNDNIYGNDFDMYNAHKLGYHDQFNSGIIDQPEQSCDQNAMSIDAINVVLAQKRNRDKKCTDGLVSKTADYYKYHYANEFKEYEDKPWWGLNEN